jgi:dihydrofolate reductase
MGKPIVMGRRTWESIGRPLPGRRNVVITRQPGYEAAGAEVVGSPAEALDRLADSDEVMIIGGGQVYAEFLDAADTVYLTQVDAEIDGDTTFPPLDESDWRLESAEAHAADERHAYGFEFRVYRRR